MKLPTIILIRHGETEWNVEGRYQGRLNSPLTEKGRLQAKKNAFKLELAIDSKQPYKFYSSPLGRAKESAIIICDTLGINTNEIIFDENIQEFNYGIFEGKTKEECAEIYSKELATRETEKWSYIIKDGESYELVTARLYLWLESVRDEKVIVMVAHEMLNRALRGIYCGLDDESILRLRQPNDVVLKLENMAESVVT